MENYIYETLEGKVDLDKVREIRRLIRRRYANRKRIQKIFGLWDKEKKGYISVQNVVEMVHNLGMRVNTDEARVLIASCDRNRNSMLDLDEFMDMLYNTDNALNVNLAKIVKLTPG